MKKQLLSTLLVLCMVLTLLPETAWAANVNEIAYPVTGGNIYFNTAIEAITGCDSDVTEAIIPSEISGIPVTSISMSAFRSCSSLTNVIIPNSVTIIGAYAFSHCSSLTSITIPEGVTRIDSNAFYGCSSLTNITIPNSVTSIGENAFIYCGLTSITIPASVTSMGHGVFFNCNGLTSITIMDGITNIWDYAFYGCTNLNSIIIPNSVTSIGDSAFRDCRGLTAINIPESVTIIGDNAFVGCDSLNSITIPNSVTSIGDNAFQGCGNLTSITIPNSVTSIGDGIFHGCYNMTSINVDTSNRHYSSIDDVLFNFDKTLLHTYPAGKKDITYTIPDSVTSVGDYAFYYCRELTNITIPAGVTSIGDSAFSECKSLINVDIPNSVTSIGESAFSNCENLTNVIISEGITSIGGYTFYGCRRLANLIIPKGVTTIGSSAFCICFNLASITIPDSVTSIGDSAFLSCDSLTDVYYGGNREQWQAITINQRNAPLLSATIHYNSTDPDDVGSDNMNPVYFLSGWDASTGTVNFGDPEHISPITYTVAGSVDVSGINSLLNRYVLVTMEQGDSVLEYIVTDIQPVESKIGTISATGEHSLTIDGTTYPVREDYLLGTYNGKEVLYHTHNGTIVDFSLLRAMTGVLEKWDRSAGKVTIDGEVYSTNYLSDVSLLDNADNVIGKKIEFLLVDKFDYSPVLSLTFCPGFYFSTNAATNSIEKGATFDLYVGYYFDDGSLDSKSKDFVSVVSDNEVVEITPAGWSDKYGQHYTAKAKEAGNATFTVTNSRNNDAASLSLFVIEKEYGYNFDNVPKLTYEEGKITNFYNHNGMVVDEFAYTPHKNANGEVDYYVVTMNVYNTLDLYGAVTAYNADGNPTGFYVIDKKGVLPSDFTHTVEDLYYEIGDLFYLIGNNSYYSGESISKKTEVTINVPVGGYIEISNSIYSEIALCTNIIGLIVDGLSSAKDLVDTDTKVELIASKPAIIHKVLSEDYIGKKLSKAIKGIATDELKNANWNYDNYGECLQAVLERLSNAGVDLIDSISKKIFSLTGVGSITESIVKKIVPTGNLIDFLYKVMGIGDQAVTWITFQKSADFAKGIYVYAPSTGKSYSSNGIEVIPSSSTVESDIVFHSYLVVDKSEVPTNVFKGASETYNIAMYRDGKETQLNATITVRIPLSDKFKGLDKSTIIVYRHNDDGTITNMNASIVDGYAVFETNHLSYYSIVTEEDTPAPITYTVIFNPNGGNLTGSATLTTSADGKLSSLPSAYRNGYTFDGWFTLASGGEQITTDYVFTSDATVYAHWSKIDTSTTPSYGSSSSSDSDPTYSIKVPSRITGGTVKVTPTSASEGQRVTITVKANSGYELDALTVADSKGNTLTLTDQGNGKYTFTMPKGNVSVDAQFQRIESSVTPVQPVSVKPTNDKLEVDGKSQTPAAYKINDYNYFKLRDIAALLNGTGKQFSVGYESSTGEVSLTSGQPYEVTTSDLTALPAESRQATISTNVIYINGVRTQLTIYKIDGYNYFKLRDLASALDFYVGWTADRGMFLESDKPYSE